MKSFIESGIKLQPIVSVTLSGEKLQAVCIVCTMFCDQMMSNNWVDRHMLVRESLILLFSLSGL